MKKVVAQIVFILAIFACVGCTAVAQTGNFAMNDIKSTVQEPTEQALLIEKEATPSDMQQATAIEEPYATPEVINISVATPTDIVLPQETPQSEPLMTAEPEQTPQLTPTAAPVTTATPVPTATPTPTPTATPVPTNTPAPTKTPEYTVSAVDDEEAYLNAGSANMRKGPGTTYDIIRELERNAQFKITGKADDWYRIRYHGQEGFVLGEFVEFGVAPTPTPTQTPVPTPTPSPKPTNSPAPTATAASTTPSPQPTQTPQQTPVPTPTQTHSASAVNASDYFSAGGGFSAEELLLLAQVVQEESKGTSVEARAAVANTIYNRIKSSKYPNSVDGVLFQKNQYTVTRNEEKLRAVKPSQQTIEAVTQIFVNGDVFLPDDILFFRSASKGTSWNKRIYYATYGNNSFFY